MENINKKRFPQEYQDLPIFDTLGHLFGSRQGDGKGFKISLTRLANELGFEGSSMGGVVPDPAFVPEMGSPESPSIWFAAGGTPEAPVILPGFGGIELTSPLNVISWNGSTAVVKEIPIEVPEVDLSGLATKAEVEPLIGDVKQINSVLSLDPVYGLDQSKRNLFEGKILAMWGDVLPSFPIYISILQNINSGLGIAIYVGKGGEDYVSYYRIPTPNTPKTGIEIVELAPINSSGLRFYLRVNWSNVTSNITSPIRIYSLPKEEIVLEGDNILEALQAQGALTSQIPTNTQAISTINTNLGTIQGAVESLKTAIQEPNPGIIGGDMSLIDGGSIRDIYVSSNNRTENVYLSFLRNSATQQTLIQFLVGDTGVTPGTALAYQYLSAESSVRTGIETISITRRDDGAGGIRPSLRIVMDWDKFGVRVYNKDGGRLNVNTGLLNTAPSLPLKEKVTTLDDRVTLLESQDAPEYLQNDLYFNVFGDVLPLLFKDKWLSYENDVEVLCVGDSITGLIQGGGAFTQPVASQLPPGCTHDYWTYMLWNRVCKNKPLSDRLDSVRGGTDFFMKIGTWSQIVDGKFDTPADIPAGEYSQSALTYQSSDVNASVVFTLNAGVHKKASIVTSINPDGADSIITISQGNGKLLASLNKTDWSEANGFTFTGRSNDGLTNTQARAAGIALHQRHRRIWLKSADGVTEELSITFSRNDANTSRFLYCWGVERWNGNTIFITNLGRGGRRTYMLNDNITDVSDRNPDLVLYEMPVANEFKDETLEDLKTRYTNYFLNTSSAKSLASKSNSYADMQCIVILPHSRGTSWSGDQAIFDSEYLTEYLPYIKSKMLINWLKETSTFAEGITFVNLQDQLINEAKYRGMTIQQSLTGSLAHKYRFVTDTIHLNNLGSRMYAKYLAPIFDQI